MADEELDAIRAARLQELQSQGQPGNQQQQKVEEQRQRQEDFKHTVLSQVLSQEARARLNTIALTKPEKAGMIENMLVNMARSGQLQGRLQEDDLRDLLEKVSEKTQQKTTVKFDRRRAALDSDDDL